MSFDCSDFNATVSKCFDTTESTAHLVSLLGQTARNALSDSALQMD